jgi:hypothetical protein
MYPSQKRQISLPPSHYARETRDNLDASTSRQDMRPVLLIQGQVRSFTCPSGDAFNQRSEDRITSRAPIRFRFSSLHTPARCVNGREDQLQLFAYLHVCVHILFSSKKQNTPVIDVYLPLRDSDLTFDTSLHTLTTHQDRVSQTFSICTPDMCHFARLGKAKRFRQTCLSQR